MFKFYNLTPFKQLLIVVLISQIQMANAQSKKTEENDFFESTLRPQLQLSINHIPNIGEKDTYLRKGYAVTAGIIKPYYSEHSDNFARVFSVVAELGYGRSDAEGALRDINEKKSAVSLAVLGSLNPAYTSKVEKAQSYHIGAGLRQDLHFNRFNMGISLTTGYQRMQRPEFRLEDKNLTFLATGEKVVYAKSMAANATGIYFKPGIDLGYRFNNHLILFTSATYRFGPSFKNATQTYLMASSTDNDAYLNANEVRAGHLMEMPFDRNTNMLNIGVGIRCHFGKL